MKLIISIQVFLVIFSNFVPAFTSAEADTECTLNKHCTFNPNDSQLKRHPTDCTKSYRCVNGEPRIYTCPPNQYFFTDLQACDVPKDEQCNVEFVECMETTPDIQGGARPETQCNMNMFCKFSPNETKLKRHPTDCTKSYRCVNGEPRVYTCPPNQYFFNDLQKCVVPEDDQCNVECAIVTTEAPAETTTVAESTAVPGEARPDAHCNINMKCKFSPNENQLKRHPIDCTKSYRCVDGVPRVYSCPPNQHFFTDLQECVVPENQQCNVEALQCSPTTTKPQTETTTVIYTTTDVQTEATTEIQTETTAKESNEESIEESNEESTEELLECDISRCPDINFDEVVYLRHHDCTKYCLCHGSLVYTLTCGDTLYFNHGLLTCDWPQNVDCTN